MSFQVAWSQSHSDDAYFIVAIAQKLALHRELWGRLRCHELHWRCSVAHIDVPPLVLGFDACFDSSGFFLGLLAGGPAAIWSADHYRTGHTYLLIHSSGRRISSR